MPDLELIRDGLLRATERYDERLRRDRIVPPLLGGPDLDPIEDELVREALERTQVFNVINGWSIWVKGHMETISIDWAVSLAAKRITNPHLRDEDGNEAEYLMHIMSARETPVTFVTAVWGPEIEADVQISERMWLRRFERGRVRRDNLSLSPFLRGIAAADLKPTLIVQSDPNFPFLSLNSPPQYASAHALRNLSDFICRTCVVFGTQRPLLDLSWFEIDDRVLDSVNYVAGDSWRSPEVIPGFVEGTQMDGTRVAQAFALWTALPDSPWRNRLLNSVSRFELSLARRKAADQAVDLCVAFEQMLGDRPDAPISWTHGLRCSRLIGGSAEARNRTRDIVETIYRARNNAVHGGIKEEPIATRTMGKLRPRDVIPLARTLYAEVLEALLKRQSEPDWRLLENGD